MPEDLAEQNISETGRKTDWLSLQRQSVNAAFSPILEMTSSSPLVTRLQQEFSEVAHKIDMLSKPAGMPDTLTEISFSNIKAAEIPQLFEEVLIEINRRTTFFKEIEDTQIAPALLTRNLMKANHGSFLMWTTPDSRIYQKLAKEGTVGQYSSLSDITTILGLPPSDKEMWRSLSTKGILPEIIATLDHELTHNAQFVESILNYWLKDDLGPDNFLSELHAFSAEAASPTSLVPELDEGPEIVKHIRTNYPGYDYIPPKRALQTFNQLQTLRMLGYDDIKLGALVAEATYDFNSQSYPMLIQEIKNTFDAMQITKSSEQIKVVKALKAHHNLNLHFQRHQARSIASDALAVYGNNRTWGKINTIS